MKSERAYNPEYFEMMNAVTALAVAVWLETLSAENSALENLSDVDQASSFFDKLLANKSLFIIEPLKEHIHTQFVAALQKATKDPSTPLESVTAELLNNFLIKTMGQAHSKMREAPYPFSTTTGGFGSGVHTLIMTEILTKLYSEKNFPGFKTASTMAKLALYDFSSFGILQIGVIDEGYMAQLQVRDRSFDWVSFGDKNVVNGLDSRYIGDAGYAPNVENAGCVGLYPPSKSFRDQNADVCSNIPAHSAIAQLRPYVKSAVENLIEWAKQKGGTRSLDQLIIPLDLTVLNGTHPNLPPHPDTHQTPASLID